MYKYVKLKVPFAYTILFIFLCGISEQHLRKSGKMDVQRTSLMTLCLTLRRMHDNMQEKHKKEKNMKKLIALTLALMMVLTLAACGANQPQEQETQPNTTENATEPTPEATTQPQQTAGSAATYVQLSISDEEGNTVSLTAYNDDMGQAYVEYVGEVKKVGTFDLSVMSDIAAELEKSGLVALNGQEVYEDGMASASMYVSYEDESYLGAGYSGNIPQEFKDGYAAMDTYFQQLVADLPVYVPRPVVSGEVNADALAAMEAILDNSGAEPLDMFTISDVPLDESFGMLMGLSDTAGITNGLSCAPMMSAVAFSCVIATAEDESKVEAISKDFAENIDWNRWVCVSATDAMIAQKGNMVLCLVTSGDLYQQITDGAEATGWTVLETLKN